MFALATVIVDGSRRPALEVDGRCFPLPRAVESVAMLAEQWPAVRFWLNQHAELCHQGAIEPMPGPPRFDLPLGHTGRLVHLDPSDGTDLIKVRDRSAALAAHGAMVNLPPEATTVTWDVGLAVAIGRDTKALGSDVADVITGYAVSICLRSHTANGRCHEDGHSYALGRRLVPAEFMPRQHGLRVSAALNGNPDQFASRVDLQDVEEGIAALSQTMTLQAGDVLFVRLTNALQGRPQVIAVGDRLNAEIEVLGSLSIQVGPIPIEKTNVVKLWAKRR